MGNLLKNMRQHLMTGVSYMIPFVVAGGVLLAVAVMISGQAAVPEEGVLKAISDIGIAGLTLFVPILGGFIAFSMVDRPGIAPGMIGAYLANQVGGGFLGGIVGGIIAGLVVFYLKKIKVPPVMRSVMPIFIIPLIGTFITGMLIIYVLGQPIAGLMTSMSAWLEGMQGASKVVLGLILGAMIAFDMGGPVNKVAYFFGVGLVATHPEVMAAVAVPICTPPIGLAIATFIKPKKFTVEEREAGKAAIIMGSIGITEGAIPFAAADPIKVIPANMVGGMVGSVIALLVGATNSAPWGGLIVLPVVNNIPGYLLAVAAGSLTTALVVIALKKDKKEDDLVTTAGDDVDLDFD
ncbi:MAG TPA: PTS fructose transporter subunit EIIC [Eubacteriaceae bacterium]|nr:PTS fructose transporter subunit EIIC [Eubacteriaceae bacterium]